MLHPRLLSFSYTPAPGFAPTHFRCFLSRAATPGETVLQNSGGTAVPFVDVLAADAVLNTTTGKLEIDIVAKGMHPEVTPNGASIPVGQDLKFGVTALCDGDTEASSETIEVDAFQFHHPANPAPGDVGTAG